jgi:hypothetical protein
MLAVLSRTYTPELEDHYLNDKTPREYDQGNDVGIEMQFVEQAQFVLGQAGELKEVMNPGEAGDENPEDENVLNEFFEYLSVLFPQFYHPEPSGAGQLRSSVRVFYGHRVLHRM